MSRLTFRQNVDRDGEWVATLDKRFNSVGADKLQAVQNLYHWMKRHHEDALMAAHDVFDKFADEFKT